MIVLDKIKDLIEVSKNYKTMYAKLQNEDQIISMTIADSISLGSNDLVLQFNLELGDNRIMVGGFKVDSIVDISSTVEDNMLCINIYI